MNTRLFSFFTLTALVLSSGKAATIILEGKYQNKNIYVQNSYGGSGVGFCTTEVRVNGNITTDEINSSAFEIDLSIYHFKMGDKVIIEIQHKDDCVPKVFNPEVLKPAPTFDMVAIKLNAAGLLQWSTRNENGSLPFVIEQFKWNKWIYVGEVRGDGNPGQHDYSFQITMHSGENKFRIKQAGLGSAPRYSSIVVGISAVTKVDYTLQKSTKTIVFSHETAFEVYDAYGSIVKKGYGASLDIANLPKGKYYLCYDNEVSEFDKKR